MLFREFRSLATKNGLHSQVGNTTNYSSIAKKYAVEGLRNVHVPFVTAASAVGGWISSALFSSSSSPSQIEGGAATKTIVGEPGEETDTPISSPV